MIDIKQTDIDKAETTKKEALITFYQEKVSDVNSHLISLQTDMEILVAAKEHLINLHKTLLKNEIDKESALLIRKAKKSRKRGLELYQQYKDHAESISNLVKEIYDIEMGIRSTNRELTKLNDDLDDVSSVASVYGHNMGG